MSGPQGIGSTKATVITDEKGPRLSRPGRFRPGRMHDQSPRIRPEGITDLDARHQQVRADLVKGSPKPHQASQAPVEAPPLKPRKEASPEKRDRLRGGQRHQQSSERIYVEHRATPSTERWRHSSSSSCLGRHDDFDEAFLAVACLVSDRAAERSPAGQAPHPSRHRPALIAHHVVRP